MNRMISPAACAHLVEHALQPLLEIAAIFGAGDDRAHVEREQTAVLDAVGHVAVGDAQREAFGDRGLADAGLADQHRIVLGPAGEHLDGAADFLVAADDRIELALARRLGEVARELLERVVAVLRRLRIGGAAAAQLIDGGVEFLRREARLGERGADVAGLGERHRQQDALDRDVAVAGFLGDLFGLVEDAHGIAVERRRLGRAAAGDRWDPGNQLIGLALRRLGIAACGLDQPRRHALLIVEQGLEQMRRRDALMMLANGDGLRRLEEAPGAIGELFQIHPSTLCLAPIWRGTKATQGFSALWNRGLRRVWVGGRLRHRRSAVTGRGCPTLATSSG